jgi:hypothetical protein
MAGSPEHGCTEEQGMANQLREMAGCVKITVFR